MLLSYKEPINGEKREFKCIVSSDSDREAVFSDEIRTIELKLMRSNKSVVITEKVIDETLVEEESTPISGRYAI